MLSSEKSFVFADRMEVYNLKDVVKHLLRTDEYLFYNHVNDAKNDFATWINDCLDNSRLAKSIKDIKKKDDLLFILMKELILEM